jgi:cytochrome c oxidase assembly protein subunit 11
MSKKNHNQIQSKFINNTIYSVIGILFLTFIFIQPYNIFCRLKNTCHPITFSSFSFHKNGKREMTINFVGTIPEALKQSVQFYPDQEKLKIRNGKNINNFYRTKNLTNQNIIVATHFDVKPEGIEKYLERIECICFKNQSLKIGKEAAMPFKFRINPAIERDPEFDNIKEITVNYSVYLVE